jgi:hypothetical protein
MRCVTYTFRALISLGFILAFVSALPFVSAQDVRAQDAAVIARPVDARADALAREVIQNEIEAQLHDTSLWCYREFHQEDGKPSKTLQVCQTKDGELDRLMAQNGSELNATQRQADDERLLKLITHPEQLRAKQKKEREDGEQERSMLRLFPDAFHFKCEREFGALVTLRFWPNPAFRPYTRAALVFHHMEGTLTVNTAQKRLVEINGRLTSEVKFLGGLLGHLDKDGTFVVKQQELADGHWDLSYMSVHMEGKALFFKTIAVQENKKLVDYRRLPHDATLQQAADFLMRDFDLHTASSASSAGK